MSAKIAPYISFLDNASAALEFYQKVLGGKLTLSWMGDFPQPDLPEEDKHKVMHGQLELDNGFVLMAADTPTGMPHNPGDTISVALFEESAEVLADIYQKLAEGGQSILPFAKAPWGASFGMLLDQFGIRWLFNSTN